MRRLIIPLVIFVLAAPFAGCSLLPSFLGGTSTVADTDPIVVIEKETQSGVNAIDAFLQVDDENRTFMRTEAPSLHAVAERLRRESPDVIRRVRAMTKAYKASPDPISSDALDKTLTNLRTLSSLARKGVLDFGAVKASASTRPS